MFSTAADNQSSVDIKVLQGERPMAADNKSIGQFRLDGILPAPRGLPQIEVTFDMDANGILNVSAKDKGTGKEQKITVTASSGLSQEEIDEMVKEAEQFAEEDARKREEVQARNAADQAVFGAEKMLKDNEDKIDADLMAEVEGKISSTKSALEGQDIDQINVAMSELQEAIQKVGQIVYSQGTDPTDENEGTEHSSDDDSDDDTPEETVEGEFREV